MKILLCHNFYQQPGGEDQVFRDEGALLEAHGHEVVRFTCHNDDIKTTSRWRLAIGTIWNQRMARSLRKLIRRERPSIVHFTNTFPLLSPAAYYAARREGAKVVQSLHNYRLLCPSALFLRNGSPCEACLGKRVPWPAVRYACYRDDRAATAIVAGMLTVHRALGTWQKAVDLFIALSEFARRKFVEGGLPAEKIAVKPNFMSLDPGPGQGAGRYAVYVGRLSHEKGIDTLLTAWSKCGIELPLKIVGDGPLADRVRQCAGQNPRVQWLGQQPADRVLEIVGAATMLVLPSITYEGFPKTIAEAYSKATPVIASNLGSMAEIVEDGRTGYLFTPGDAASLSAAVRHLADNEETARQMRRAARREFEQKYTAETNYETLIRLYRLVLAGEPTESRSVAAALDLPAADRPGNGPPAEQGSRPLPLQPACSDPEDLTFGQVAELKC